MTTTQDDQPSPADTTPSLVSAITRWSRVTYSFVAVFAGLLMLVAVNEVHFEPRVRRAVEGARVLREAHETMLDQDSTLRAYVLTGDRRFLPTYEASVRQLEELNDEVHDVVRDVPGTSDLLLEYRVRQTAWLEGWTGAALDAGSDTAQGEQVVGTALVIEGAQLFGAYEAAHDALLTRLTDHRRETFEAQSDAIRLTAVATGIITLAAAAVTVRRSVNLRRSVEPPLEDLLAHLSAIRAGDYRPRAPIEGPEEIGRIAAEVREVAASLGRAADDADAHAEEVRVHNQQLAQVLRLAREVAGSLNMRYVLRGVCESASTIADGRRVIVWLRAPDSRTIDPMADTDAPDLQPVGLEAITIGDGVVGRAARFGRVEGHAADLVDTDDGADELAVPMVVGAEVIGVLLVCGDGVSALPQRTLDVLEALSVQAASAIASARVHEKTETMAMTDALTHLPNRRQLEIDLATEVQMSTRYDRPLAFAMIDVDHFKAYNDSLGHQAADAALREMAHLLHQSVRAGDTVYRYGGEEIAVLMRETTTTAGEALAQRLRVAVEHHFVGPSQPRPVTVSAGVAALPEHGSTAEEMVAAADAALYEAKRAGRNRVCVASDPVAGQVSGH